jgi:hypothetical protein
MWSVPSRKMTVRVPAPALALSSASAAEIAARRAEAILGCQHSVG